jgi:imidazolonepropionase
LRSLAKTRQPRPLLLVNIGQLLTVSSPSANSVPRRGAQLRELGILEDAAVLCVAGTITSVGKTKDAFSDPWVRKHRRQITEIDCRGKVVLPGFVDSHTHPAFVSPRLVDFEKRIAGASYEEIARSGGGIRSSVEDVRRADIRELTQKILTAFEQMLEQGTTTVEAKSGYGLSVEAELKSLEAIRTAGKHWPGTVVSTLLGAHVAPPEFKDRQAEYVRRVCEEMVPQAARRKLANFVDVFCDRGAFSLEDTLQIFAAAGKNGLRVRAHVSQFTRTSIAKLLSLNPASLDHLDHADPDDISALARSKTVATLVPGANYFLGTEYPPARKLIDGGVPVALATDFNPGSSPLLSMPFVLSLACTQMKMSPAEAIAAATINGACALGLEARKGSIKPGKDADLTIFDVSDYREIAYWVASNKCKKVIAGGVLVQ